MRRQLRISVALLIGFMSALCGLDDLTLQAAETAHVDLRIGLSLQPSNALVIIAMDRGYLKEQGINFSVSEYESGTRALVDGLFTEKIDVTTASDVPIVLNAFRRQDFSIVATIFGVDNQNRIIARADKGIRKPEDLAGKRVATQRGSAVHFFLYLFLLEHDIPERDVNTSFMRAAELPEALARGDIDAFSMREPYIGQARELLGENAAVFAAPGLYYQTDQVVVTNRFLKEYPDVVEKLLRALVKAEAFTAMNPEDAQAIVARRLGVSKDEIAESWPAFAPRVRLEQSLLLRLEDIARWAVHRNFVPNDSMPNFLNLIDFTGLEAVRSDAITMYR